MNMNTLEEKTIQEFERENFQGVDVNLSTSLFEYGLLWKEIEPNRLLFIYAISYDEDSNATLFDYCHWSRDEIREIWDEDWFDLKQFESFIGEPVNQENPEYEISAMVSYYGYENIFGGSYAGFDVKDEDKIEDEDDL